jgi:hypothetical protein
MRSMYLPFETKVSSRSRTCTSPTHLIVYPKTDLFVPIYTMRVAISCRKVTAYRTQYHLHFPLIPFRNSHPSIPCNVRQRHNHDRHHPFLNHIQPPLTHLIHHIRPTLPPNTNLPPHLRPTHTLRRHPLLLLPHLTHIPNPNPDSPT